MASFNQPTPVLSASNSSAPGRQPGENGKSFRLVEDAVINGLPALDVSYGVHTVVCLTLSAFILS